MNNSYFKVANFVIFQLIWVSAVVFQNKGLWVCLALLALHFALSPQRKEDITRTYKAILIGIALDFTLMQTGIFAFEGNHFPLWLVCLWVGFVLTLRHSMAWLSNKPLYWQIPLGACGGTLSYLSGAKFGAVQLSQGWAVSAVILIVAWGTLLPLFFRIINQEKSYEKLAKA